MSHVTPDTRRALVAAETTAATVRSVFMDYPKRVVDLAATFQRAAPQMTDAGVHRAADAFCQYSQAVEELYYQLVERLGDVNESERPSEECNGNSNQEETGR